MARASRERLHRLATRSNALRAAVLGANDGLVSNFSLVMGVAGADIAGRTILLIGMAGLIAGACSMAIGEWLSVTSSRELDEHEIETDHLADDGLEADEISGSPLGAAVSSFGLFSAGAAFPLAPFFCLAGIPAVVASAAASGLALMAIGISTSYFTGRPLLRAALRQLGGGFASAAITYAAGQLIAQ